MEHEVNVPFSVGSVRAALAEPGRVAHCVPGLQLDGDEAVRPAKTGRSTGSADARSTGSTVEGRLRVRVGGSTITYRGSLTITSRGEEFTVKGTGTEARGSGSVRLNLTVVPRRAKDGESTRLVCSGTVKADGRLKDVEPKTVTSAGHRLLERFGAALGESIQQDPPPALDSPDAPAAEPAATAGPTGGIGEPDDNERVIPGIPGPDNREAAQEEKHGKGRAESAEDRAAADESAGGKDRAGEQARDRAEPGGTDNGTGDGTGKGTDNGTAEGTDAGRDAGPDKTRAETPGPDGDTGGKKGRGTGGKQAGGEAEGQEADKDRTAPEGEAPQREGIFGTEVPPSSLDPFNEEPLDEAEVEAAAEAEAAHARRTMIGRSAEEVDHAPPRGRYAPIPVPEPIANSAALRWVAPAAAAVVAGFVVIGRALRRRR
ncbi:hypothetical protein [Streptomyces sp. WMMB 322]|uniref:hypothetical protein n=1 Tax=Streptomyces sp. WMMB 322 TaxID=1286821 RepID=UPI0006E32FF9|nr:hypothetical protein [Streptomyces sp. WMMB 322]SCK38263.1 Carbon monoxide dehydrogenase subunit G [Streptomyces sp. WMMB 322]